jgi:hypothetical protein
MLDTSAPGQFGTRTLRHLKGWIKTIGMIGIFSETDMIKIWNWFTAIGRFVRKIQEKNTSAELSWCRNLIMSVSEKIPIMPIVFIQPLISCLFCK